MAFNAQQQNTTKTSTGKQLWSHKVIIWQSQCIRDTTSCAQTSNLTTSVITAILTYEFEMTEKNITGIL